MTISLILLSSLTLTLTIKAKNPVKTSISILLVSILLFFTVGSNTGTTWIPILMLMLFMGGIIMMFMILSSVLPNEKSGKIKNQMIFLFILFLMISLSNWTAENQMVASEMKMFLTSGQNFLIMMAIILIYFTGCMSMVASEQTPMRSMTCLHLLIL